MKEKIFLEQSAQQLLNILEALHFYRDNAIKPKYHEIINKQLEDISQQVKLQNIEIFMKNYDPEFIFGQEVIYEDKTAVVIGMSDADDFVKIAVAENNKMEVIEVPIVLIDKVRRE